MDIIELAEKITNKVKNGDYVAGHAIFPGREKYYDVTPEKILAEGLNIQDASSGIAFTSRRFEPIFKECLDNLTDLAQNSQIAVVIIDIPGELIEAYDGHYFRSLDSSSILLEETDRFYDCYKDAYDKPTHIALLSTQYLAGYFDVKENIFIR